jgi:hypothetical protein
MEPPPTLEAEFQDWYDNEHFPERQQLEGFLTANRYVCLDGWPRYLAAYDLASVDVLGGPAYATIAHKRYSVWTRRIIPQVWGHYRAEARQIFPGTALMSEKGAACRLVLWRFGNVPRRLCSSIADGLRSDCDGDPAVLQFRLFESCHADAPELADYIAMIELCTPNPERYRASGAFGEALRYLNLCNTYTRYWRD